MFQFRDLDEDTRELMGRELETDVAMGKIYMSNRLTPEGKARFLMLLNEAFQRHDEEWLARELEARHLLLSHEIRQTQSGLVRARVPADAAHILAEGEFNHYYSRAVCIRALQSGFGLVSVYRAKDVHNPRPESEEKVGRMVEAEPLLAELRSLHGLETSLGIPAGPNSGLSVCLAGERASVPVN